jgi:Ran-binding protein 1
MVLSSNVGSDRSWVYSALADFSEGEARSELLAIRFANTESMTHFLPFFNFYRRKQI